jgi:hypothetical protein
MMNRRQFMQKGALFAAASRLGGPLADRSRIELGAQTNAWTIDPARFETFLGVLDQIRDVEASTLEGLGPQRGRA